MRGGLIAALGRRRGSSLPTPAEFLAHISAKESPTTVAWGTTTDLTAAFTFITTGAADGGFMYGSPWNDHVYFGASPGYVVRHGVSSAAQANAIIANARPVWFKVSPIGDQSSFNSIDRNGYASIADSGTPYGAFRVLQQIWWDEVLGPRTRAPFAGGTETAYAW